MGNLLKKRKFWKRLVIALVILPVLLFTTAVAIIYWKQDDIVQHVIKTANEDFKGKITLEGSHISPFANFPYISIDLEDLRVFETKDTLLRPVIYVKDTYIGFNLWTLMRGEFDIQSIMLSDGDIDIVEYDNNELNISRAFEPMEEKTIDELEEDFHFNLKEIILSNVDIDKVNPDSLMFEAFFNHATIGFKSDKEHLYFGIDSDFELSLIDKGDTSFINKKPMVSKTKVDYFIAKDSIVIAPSSLFIDDVKFQYQGGIDVLDNFNLNLNFSGKKPDFGLLIALAPDDIIPILKTFDNRGDVFFDASVKGPSINGHVPYVEARFGCQNGYFENPSTSRVLDELSFQGYFTNGEDRTLESMRFEIKDFNATPESGRFKVNLLVENFNSPEIDLELTTLFELDYLAQFLNVQQLTELSGKVELIMNFHDIIDLEHPEKAIEQLNEAYFTELNVENLAFRIPGYERKIRDINIGLKVEGKKANLDNFSFRVGGSDIAIAGNLDDLPAVIHHSSKKVNANLEINSNALDVNELLLADEKTNEAIDEYIRNLSLEMSFHSSAKALTESPYLPYGDFKLQKLNAKLTNYPHELHDFWVDVSIDTHRLVLNHFHGEVDQSDFDIRGTLHNYPFWFKDVYDGDVKANLDISSKQFEFKDIFSFDGENFMPEDYREEVLSHFDSHFDITMQYREEKLHSTDFYLNHLTGKMKVHPLKLERFNGRAHLEDDQLTVEDFSGKMGNTMFTTSLDYYLGESVKKKENKLVFNSPRLDFDQLFDYEAPEPDETIEHDSVFSIFDVPFPDMSFDLDIKKMNYHNYLLENILAQLRTTKNHQLFIDQLDMDIAGGHLAIDGYFNGENREQIYFHPTIIMKDIDIDRVMIKFDNFGQDEVLSDNLHGRISGKLWGKIHTHADLTPIIEDSDIKMDISVVGGSVENYGPLKALSDYFEDDKLHKVIFDTLSNHINMKSGVMDIPEMLINTNLGFIKVSGRQDMEMNMEYYLRVPLKMVTSAGSRKLFGKKGKESDPEAISTYDPNKKYRYVNIKIVGNAEDYKVSLGKQKKE